MYIGWDIGIKNLSYCLIKKVVIPDNIILKDDIKTFISNLDNVLFFDSNYYQIVDWKVINIVSNVNDKQLTKGEMTLSQRPELKCKMESNGKKKDGTLLCNKKAVACAVKKSNNEYVGYCSFHLKRSSLDIKDYIDCKLNVCNCHIWNSKKNAKCGNKAVYIDKNHYYLGYCRKHYNELIKGKCDDNKSIKSEKDFIKIIKQKKASSINLTNLADSLYDELDKYDSILDAEIVLLENQPVLKNPTMKSVQMFLYAYYVMKGYKNPNKSVNTIQCYMASKKLDIIKLMDIDIYNEIKAEIKQIKSQYNRNKRVAIRLTENILKDKSINCDEYKDMFNNSKKKDDLSDSLLMTLHYLEKDIIKNKKIVEIENSPLLKRKKVSKSKKEEISGIEINNDIKIGLDYINESLIKD